MLVHETYIALFNLNMGKEHFSSQAINGSSAESPDIYTILLFERFGSSIN
jgi:hypothetical protein